MHTRDRGQAESGEDSQKEVIISKIGSRISVIAISRGDSTRIEGEDANARAGCAPGQRLLIAIDACCPPPIISACVSVRPVFLDRKCNSILGGLGWLEAKGDGFTDQLFDRPVLKQRSGGWKLFG